MELINLTDTHFANCVLVVRRRAYYPSVCIIVPDPYYIFKYQTLRWYLILINTEPWAGYFRSFCNVNPTIWANISRGHFNYLLARFRVDERPGMDVINMLYLWQWIKVGFLFTCSYGCYWRNIYTVCMQSDVILLLNLHLNIAMVDKIFINYDINVPIN